MLMVAVAEPEANVVVPVVGVKSVVGWAVPATVVKPTVICELRSPVRVTVKTMFTVPIGDGSSTLALAIDSEVGLAAASAMVIVLTVVAPREAPVGEPRVKVNVLMA